LSIYFSFYLLLLLVLELERERGVLLQLRCVWLLLQDGRCAAETLSCPRSS
jgi:hypothetical protein